MKHTSAFILSLFIIIGANTGCGVSLHCCLIAPPSLNLTSEKTAVERQIVGDYHELEKDAWIVSSVKNSGSAGRSKSDMTGDPELIRAEKVRAFHAERLAAYKSEGAAGEGSDGLVAYLKSDKYEADSAQKKMLLGVIDEENMARRIIFRQSLLAMNTAEPTAGELAVFGKIFAEEQRVLANKGEWIQDNSGKWVKKK